MQRASWDWILDLIPLPLFIVKGLLMKPNEGIDRIGPTIVISVKFADFDRWIVVM